MESDAVTSEPMKVKLGIKEDKKFGDINSPLDID
jgi:hypothetical protein